MATVRGEDGRMGWALLKIRKVQLACRLGQDSYTGTVSYLHASKDMSSGTHFMRQVRRTLRIVFLLG